MDALDALLGAELKIEKDVPIKRLNTHFRIKAIDGETLNKLREQSTHYVGKGANRKSQFNDNEFNGALIATACISPDFSNAKLLEKYGAADAGECVQKALLAGEIMSLQEEVLRLSGFDDGEEQYEEIKN
ncbi:phage tail assembly chaperone [Neobacillus mesonae]|uniref:Phage portal protein n=1 Tax=Neobacillus mesonae TaxID=1193713 RepID=A0A3T0HVE4_9BACI|nr:hypothetical protein [Neobacillus mesonae]AZU61075.1 hypothetical protein CHR53_07305 [Neobacillus mesonae]